MEEDRYTRITLRIPRELHAALTAEADSTSKSLNAEIIARLHDSFRDQQALRLLHERRKLELVASYVEWCAKREIDPREGFTSYAKAYKEAHDLNDFSADIETVSGVTNVDHTYLSELYANWIIERPGRFPELADKNQFLEVTIHADRTMTMGDLTVAMNGIKEKVGDQQPMALKLVVDGGKKK